ncbi:MAG: diguanylate cyclase [Peptococcaceae bacterium]|jgi:diguanylate cyclase (GGDEF)-like protein|nr:diguanylate cyclase [Peptococcaceae bacterium]
MPYALVLQYIAAAFSVVLLFISLLNWRERRMTHYVLLSLAVCALTVGYLLEVTSPSLAAAVIACKVAYLGIPFVGPFFLMFCLDYVNWLLRQKKLLFLLTAPSALITALVFTWPAQRLYYIDLAFVDTGWLPHLVVMPGPLYYFNFIYNLLLSALGCAILFRSLLHSRPQEKKYITLFIFAGILPLMAQIFRLTEFVPDGWDPTPLALVLSSALLGWFLMRFRQPDWQSLGRDMVVQNMKDAFILLDTNGCFMDANDTAFNYFPALRQASRGVSIQSVPDFPARLFNAAEDNTEFTLDKNSEPLYLRVSRSPLETSDRVLGTAILLYDVTENHRLMQELRQIARHDGLTGLYNRGTFFSAAQRDFDLCRRNQNDGSVLMMDLDHFKSVNDTHGHACGDKVLVDVAQILLTRLRHTDISGRYGGEEFCVWLPGAPGDGAAVIAESIREEVKQLSFMSASGSFGITISIGVAPVDYSREQNFEELVGEADTALYDAKNSGRDRVCIYRAPDREVSPLND